MPSDALARPARSVTDLAHCLTYYADSLDIPIVGVLREQARQLRAKRCARAREAAQKVPVKILAPLMLCFLPGLFIIILRPAAVTVVEWLVAR